MEMLSYRHWRARTRNYRGEDRSGLTRLGVGNTYSRMLIEIVGYDAYDVYFVVCWWVFRLESGVHEVAVRM